MSADDELDRAVTDALAGTEASAALTDRWRDRLREDGGDEVEPNYFPLDLTYEWAEVVGTFPGGEPMVVYHGCHPTSEQE